MKLWIGHAINSKLLLWRILILSSTKGNCNLEWCLLDAYLDITLPNVSKQTIHFVKEGHNIIEISTHTFTYLVPLSISVICKVNSSSVVACGVWLPRWEGESLSPIIWNKTWGAQPTEENKNKSKKPKIDDAQFRLAYTTL